MAVIREQRQFKIGPIGVARASQAGQIIGEAISNSANQMADMFFREAAQRAEKKGMETGSSVDREAVITINPKTGQPEAYETPKSFGSIASDAYQRVVMRRFQQSIEDEIQIKAKELSVRFEDNPNGVALYESAMSDYLASMSNVAEGPFKGYIQDVGTSYLNATRTNLAVAQIRKERAAARQAQIAAINNGLNNIESIVAQQGPRALVGPTQTQAIIGSVGAAINDGSSAGLFDASEPIAGKGKTNLAVTRGLIRHAAMSTSDPEALQLLQYAVGTQNPDAVPPQFSYIADAMRGLGNDYSALAGLEKFSDGLLTDAVQYSKIVQANEVERQNAEINLRIFDMEQNVSANASARTSVAMNPASNTSAVAVNAITAYSQQTREARSAMQAGQEDLSNATLARRDAFLKADAEGLYLRALSGLSTDDTKKLEQAIFERNPMLAPESARNALGALMTIEEQIGVAVVDDFLPVIGSYREAAGKAIDIQVRAEAANEAADIDIRAVTFATDPKAAAEEALKQLNSISGLDETLRASLEAQIQFNAGKNSLNKFFSTRPSEAAVREAKSLLEDGGVDATSLTEAQINQLALARDAANQAGKVSEMRTVFNNQANVAAGRRNDLAKQEERARTLQQINMGMGNGRDKDQRALYEDDIEQRYASVLGGRTLASIWSDPTAFQNRELAPIFQELSTKNVMPESLHAAFTSLARGAWMGGDPNVLISHYNNFRSYNYEGVAMSNPMMDALTDTEQTMLDYLADTIPVFGNDAPDRIAEIFRVKQQYEEDAKLKEKVKTFFKDKTLEEYVMGLSGMENVPPSAFNAISAAALNLFTTSRSSGLSLSEMTNRLESQIERSYPSGGGYVYGAGFTERTRFPISKAAPGNEYHFREHIVQRISEANPSVTPIFGTPGRAERFVFGEQDYFYLQPLDASSNGEIRYIVKQRLPAEMGGDRVVTETVLDEGSEYSAPIIISNADYGYVNRVTADRMREDREAIEEGKLRLQEQEERLKQSFSDIEGLSAYGQP